MVVCRAGAAQGKRILDDGVALLHVGVARVDIGVDEDQIAEAHLGKRVGDRDIGVADGAADGELRGRCQFAVAGCPGR